MVLAVSFTVVVSLERLFPCSPQTLLQTAGPSRAHPIAGTVLDGIHPRLFYILHNAGILFDALLSRPGAVAGLCHGCGRGLDSPGNPRTFRYGASGGNHNIRNFCCCAPPTKTRQYFASTEPSSQCLNALPWAHVGHYFRLLCLSTACNGGGLAVIS